MSVEPIKKLTASGADNICLFYSVLLSLSIRFEKMKETKRIDASKKLRVNIIDKMRKTPKKDRQIASSIVDKEVEMLETNQYAGEPSIFFLAKYFKINILVVANTDILYSLFFSSTGTGKYENQDDFIILYNFKNRHFEPIEIMGSTVFSYSILAGLLLELENVIPSYTSLKEKDRIKSQIITTTFIDYLRSYIQEGYNRNVKIDKFLVGNTYKTISEAFDV